MGGYNIKQLAIFHKGLGINDNMKTIFDIILTSNQILGLSAKEPMHLQLWSINFCYTLDLPKKFLTHNPTKLKHFDNSLNKTVLNY